MPLYIRDDAVAELARAVQSASGARTVTDAVRAALERERDRLKASLPPSARLGKAMALADTLADAVGARAVGARAVGARATAPSDP